MLEKLKALPSKIIPSLKSLITRFPVATVLIILEFIGLVIITENDYLHTHQKEAYIYALFLLGIYSSTMLSIAIQLLFEKVKVVLWKKILSFLVAIAIVAGFIYFIEYKDVLSFAILSGTPTGNFYKLAVFVVLTTLIPFVLPFIKDLNSKEWWNFMLTTFSRAVISSLYSLAIYVGLSLALFAIQSFWKFTFFPTQYIHLSLVCFVLVLPLHFLNGLYDLSNPQEHIELPKFLLILVKFILTPLIGIYTLILYPYIAGFPFKEEWPANVATWIILALLAMVYLGIILLYGVKEDDSNAKFKKLYIKITSGITIPTIIFWAYSLYLRINAYGMTVTRFLLMAIIFWFAAMSITYVLNHKTNIKYVIGSFIVLIFGVFYLPFTAYFWSEKSQTNNLINIAKDEGIFQNNTIVKGEKTKVKAHYYEMYEKLYYINITFGLDTLKKSLSSDINNQLEINNYGYSSKLNGYYSSYYLPSGIKNLFFKSEPIDSSSSYNNTYYYIYLDKDHIEIPSGYTKTAYYDGYNQGTNNARVSGDNEITFNNEIFEINLNVKNNQEISSNPIVLTKSSYQSNNKYASDQGLMTFKSKNGSSILVITKLYINMANENAEKYTISRYSGFNGYLFSK